MKIVINIYDHDTTSIPYIFNSNTIPNVMMPTIILQYHSYNSGM